MRDPETEGFTERFMHFSGRIVLGCGRCGEKLVLLGHEEDWHLDTAVFECECGEELTAENRTDDETLLVKELLRTDGISSN